MGQTKFETIGIQHQMESESKRDAMEQFKLSCNICCTAGAQIRCDQCRISAANTLVVSTFDLMDAPK